MSKRKDGAQEAKGKSKTAIISLIQSVESRPFDARELGHIDILISMAQDTRLSEAAMWALEYFAAMDEANSKIHTAPARYSPITFRLAEALAAELGEDGEWPLVVSHVLQHLGTYEEGPGR